MLPHLFQQFRALKMFSPLEIIQILKLSQKYFILMHTSRDRSWREDAYWFLGRVKRAWTLPTNPLKLELERSFYVLGQGMLSVNRKSSIFPYCFDLVLTVFYRFQKLWYVGASDRVTAFWDSYSLRRTNWLVVLQNDFEIFGIDFKSRTPVPIDSLISNLGETA